jgi:hypothetical protein
MTHLECQNFWDGSTADCSDGERAVLKAWAAALLIAIATSQSMAESCVCITYCIVMTMSKSK